MAHIEISAPIKSRSIFVPAPVKFLIAVVSLYTQRRALANLSDQALTDIGVSRAEADAEAKRPVWDAPAGYYSA